MWFRVFGLLIENSVNKNVKKSISNHYIFFVYKVHLPSSLNITLLFEERQNRINGAKVVKFNEIFKNIYIISITLNNLQHLWCTF